MNDRNATVRGPVPSGIGRFVGSLFGDRRAGRSCGVRHPPYRGSLTVLVAWRLLDFNAYRWIMTRPLKPSFAQHEAKRQLTRKICSEVETRIEAILFMTLGCVGLMGEVIVEQTYQRDTDISRQLGSNGELRSLGWALHYMINQSIEDLVSCYCSLVTSRVRWHWRPCRRASSSRGYPPRRKDGEKRVLARRCGLAR